MDIEWHGIHPAGWLQLVNLGRGFEWTPLGDVALQQDIPSMLPGSSMQMKWASPLDPDQFSETALLFLPEI